MKNMQSKDAFIDWMVTDCGVQRRFAIECAIALEEKVPISRPPTASGTEMKDNIKKSPSTLFNSPPRTLNHQTPVPLNSEHYPLIPTQLLNRNVVPTAPTLQEYGNTFYRDTSWYEGMEI
jgi:hypothetical protein